MLHKTTLSANTAQTECNWMGSEVIQDLVCLFILGILVYLYGCLATHSLLFAWWYTCVTVNDVSISSNLSYDVQRTIVLNFLISTLRKNVTCPGQE